MRQRVCVAIAAVLIWIATPACGGSPASNSTPTGPTPTTSEPTPTPSPSPVPEPSPSPPAPPTPTVFTPQFIYDDGVSMDLRQQIEQDTVATQDYFTNRFRRGMHSTVPIRIRTAECQSQAIRGGIELCGFWLRSGRVSRAKIFVHELFHVLQSQNGLVGSRPCAGCPFSTGEWWHVEGSAEVVGYAFIVDKGMGSYQVVRECQLLSYFSNGGSSAPPLRQLGFAGGPGYYELVWVAWDRLLNGMSGISKIGDWVQGTPFNAAFSVNSDQFSDEFEVYRRTLTRPNAFGCGALYNPQ